MRGLIFATVVLGVSATQASAQQGVDPERRALFVSILEANDCKINNIAPAPGILEGIETNGFSRDEVRAIAQDLLETGEGVREGEAMVLKTENCA